MATPSCCHVNSKSQCRICSPDNFCSHNTLLLHCRSCNQCIHNLYLKDCIQCSSRVYCHHNIMRFSCISCSSHLFCVHRIKRRLCHSCNLCQHKLYKDACIQCSPHLYCPHKTRKFKCTLCNTHIIYVLQLEHNCYYIGRTSNLNDRYQEHLKGKGAVWTRLHKPLKVDKIFNTNKPFDEDRIIKEYMALYGIHKVRGGSYVTITLTKEQIQLLQQEIRTAHHLCFYCGCKDHFIAKCPHKTPNYISG